MHLDPRVSKATDLRIAFAVFVLVASLTTFAEGRLRTASDFPLISWLVTGSGNTVA